LTGEKFYFHQVSPVKIKNAVFSITSSAEGEDRVCIKMLKLILNPILPTLTNIVNTSLQTSSFPASWKRSLICPIPKNDYPTSPNDFRPISILNAQSKILEKIAHDQILDFVNDENIFDPLQSGFRKLHSTGTALLRISEDIKAAFHKKEVVLMVFLDFSKAFDTVNHKLLLNKLRQLNFSDAVIKWLESYLSGRTQAVRDCKGNISDWCKVECGVPQGSPLSSLLYSLFSFDISKILRHRCKYHIYADDTQMYITCKEEELALAINIMNFVLEDVFNWSESHGLKLNPSKTQAMILTPNKIHISTENLPTLTLNNKKIEYFEYVKNLGVMFDKNLSWNKHISLVCQKVYGTLNNLEKFRDSTPEKIRLQLVKSLILPHFDYCSFVYCDLNQEQMSRLQKALNCSIEYVYNVPFAASLSQFYHKAGILKVRDQGNLNVLCMTHKILYENAPRYLSDLVTKSSDVNQRTMRSHKMKLRAPLAGVQVPVSSFKVISYRLWETIPQNVCLINSIDAFKHQIKELYLKKYV
jgi:retron-type reverse transcriptase